MTTEQDPNQGPINTPADADEQDRRWRQPTVAAVTALPSPFDPTGDDLVDKVTLLTYHAHLLVSEAVAAIKAAGCDPTQIDIQPCGIDVVVNLQDTEAELSELSGYLPANGQFNVAGPVIPARRDGVHLVFRCEFCRRNHYHGVCSGDPTCPAHRSQGGKTCICPPGSGDGHRAAHCHNPESPYADGGYVLREVAP